MSLARTLEKIADTVAAKALTGDAVTPEEMDALVAVLGACARDAAALEGRPVPHALRTDVRSLREAGVAVLADRRAAIIRGKRL
jgi:hypothetical protein